MGFLILLGKGILAWLVAKKVALLALIMTLGGLLSGLNGQVSDLIYSHVSQLMPELFSILCLAGVWEAFDVLLLAGQFAFWWWAVGAFFKLKG